MSISRIHRDYFTHKKLEGGVEMTFDEFYLDCYATISVMNQRIGQYLMNRLWNVRPDLHRRVTLLSGLDPFYEDDFVPGFWKFLAENWDREDYNA